jgi:propanol-preferring alcohol dehydrogenase
MMKAAVVTSFTEPLEIKQVPIPQLGPNDILIKNIACGVCHSDVHLAKGGYKLYFDFSQFRFFFKDWDFRPPLPRIVGHEGVGEVIQLGSNVDDNFHLKKGDIVGVPILIKTCLHCEYCLTGRESLCPDQRNSGVTDDGAFAEYVVVDANFAIKLPEGMDPFTSAPLFCAGVTVYKALKVSQARPGQWVSIIGIGGLGKILQTFHDLMEKILFYFLGSLALSYGVAMGLRMLAIVAPNDQVRLD